MRGNIANFQRGGNERPAHEKATPDLPLRDRPPEWSSVFPEKKRAENETEGDDEGEKNRGKKSHEGRCQGNPH